MLTKTDTIKVGKAICDAVRKEQLCIPKYRDSTGLPVCTSEEERKAMYSARGTGCYAMDNLWHDVVPLKVKYPFGQDNLSVYTKEQWYRDCGWPE